MSLFGLLNQNSGQYVMRDSAFTGSHETKKSDVTISTQSVTAETRPVPGRFCACAPLVQSVNYCSLLTVIYCK